jgi:hypothetical protein
MTRLLKMAAGYFVALMILGSSAHSQEPGGPLETATRFFDANQAGHCDAAFPLYTKAVQENIRATKRRNERERDDSPAVRTVENIHCHSFRQTRRGTVRLVRQGADEAFVAREWTVGHWLNKYIKYGPWSEGTEQLRLVREDGAWRVDTPLSPVGRERSTGESVKEVGRVDVSVFPHNSLGQDVLEANMGSPVPRPRFEAVLKEPAFWVKLLPLVETVDVLDAPEGSQRLRLNFTGSDRPVVVTVNTPGERIDRIRFDAGHNAPIMFWGWWNLSYHPDGTRIQLRLFVNKKQWPGDMGERLAAPERLAEAVLALEQAAQKGAGSREKGSK